MCLENPGPWLALIHGDPCPDNAVIVGNGVRLIDYESARPAHALIDGIYLRMGFPTCWCAGQIPSSVVERIESVYRTEIGKSIPIALDARAFR